MIEIKCAAPDTAYSLCEKNGIIADAVLVMTEREEQLGFVCMRYDGEEATLLHLQAPDTPLTDALLRAALNSARSAGMKTAHIVCEPLLSHMMQKGYFAQSDPKRVKIADFFAKSACKA